MTEQQELITELSEAGVLGGVRWAFGSAVARTRQSYSELDGHDAAWVGNTRFTLLRNRLDRVFACERYTVAGSGDVDTDVLFAELSEQDISTMPRLAPDLVQRRNLNGSPGWAYREYRFLLASSEFGKIETLPWPERSPTKQQVAAQRNPEPEQHSLFDSLADEEVGGLIGMATAAQAEPELTTYVVAHSLNVLTGEVELVLGRARLNAGGGPAWHWRENIWIVPPAGGQRGTGGTPLPTDPTPVPDAPVRLRRRTDTQSDSTAGSEQ